MRVVRSCGVGPRQIAGSEGDSVILALDFAAYRRFWCPFFDSKHRPALSQRIGRLDAECRARESLKASDAMSRPIQLLCRQNLAAVRPRGNTHSRPSDRAYRLVSKLHAVPDGVGKSMGPRPDWEHCVPNGTSCAHSALRAREQGGEEGEPIPFLGGWMRTPAGCHPRGVPDAWGTFLHPSEAASLHALPGF